MKDKTEILDLLEKLLVDYAQKLCAEVGKEVTKEEARNLVAKIGSRIMFSKSIPVKDLDDIIVPTPRV